MTKSESQSVRVDVVRQLERFPIEVLEMALQIIEAREAKEATIRNGT